LSALASTAAGAHGMSLGAMLPDERLLSRLATEFFQALPGVGIESPVGARMPSGPTAPQPSVAGAAATSQPPQALKPTVPTSDLRQVPAGKTAADIQAVDVPSAYASALPQVPVYSPLDVSPPVSAPMSPYYYIAEASAQSASLHPAESGGGADRVTARSFALPGQETLLGLFAPVDSGAAAAHAGAGAAPSAHPGFYFLDPVLGRSLAGGSAHPAFDVNAVRRDFPILQERVNGRQLVWLDNAATTHKPQAVIDRVAYFYAHENSNIHRAAHTLAARSTDAYEAARQKVTTFLGAASPDEIVFVRGATEAINLAAHSWGRQHIGADDEIIVSHLEHHANIVPWQQLAAATGARLRVIPVDDSGQVLLDEYQRLLSDRTKLVAVTHVSNALGTVTPIHDIVELAHRAGAKVLVDGAQSVSHMRVNVQSMDADFFVFSGHKVFAPTGIGVLYAKAACMRRPPSWPTCRLGRVAAT
jgi:cysteine desulfurase/selenocysteine lyase